MARQEEYVSPFSARYISKEMSHLFSAKFKVTTFRRLWIALAKGQKKMGLPIKRSQIAQMEKHLHQIDFDKTEQLEKRFRHDVMAHIHAYGEACPDAKPIIHLGATSNYVNDNADLIQIKEGLGLLFGKLLHIIRLLSAFAKREASTPCLGYTHFQPAQPTTVGKRAALWLQDFFMDAQEWERQLHSLPFLGAKGATGTQASYMALFEKDSQIDELEKFIASSFGFEKILTISGQTYTRKLDIQLLNSFASFAASAHKMATDLRLLAHENEIVESFGKTQVGSSAMPFKRNPIHSERICGIARFVIALSQNPTYTTATQWLERSLDDSSNRRLSIPEAFLGVDAILNLLSHLIANLSVDRKVALDRVKEQLPFLVQENILMLAVKKGGDRQALHETLRKLSKSPQNLQKTLEIEFGLSKSELQKLFKIDTLVGRSEKQVARFLKEEIQPLLSRHKKIRTAIPPIDI